MHEKARDVACGHAETCIVQFFSSKADSFAVVGSLQIFLSFSRLVSVDEAIYCAFYSSISFSLVIKLSGGARISAHSTIVHVLLPPPGDCASKISRGEVCPFPTRGGFEDDLCQQSKEQWHHTVQTLEEESTVSSEVGEEQRR